MTAINRLISELKKANPKPEFAYIKQKDVRSFAEHMRMTTHNPEGYNIDFFEKAIENGEARIMGIPMRVLK